MSLPESISEGCSEATSLDNLPRIDEGRVILPKIYLQFLAAGAFDDRGEYTPEEGLSQGQRARRVRVYQLKTGLPTEAALRDSGSKCVPFRGLQWADFTRKQTNCKPSSLEQHYTILLASMRSFFFFAAAMARNIKGWATFNAAACGFK